MLDCLRRQLARASCLFVQTFPASGDPRLVSGLFFFSSALSKPQNGKNKAVRGESPLKGQPLCLIKLLVRARDGKLRCNCGLS